MSEAQRNNSFVYAFDKIRTPRANEDDLKAFTRKVNAAFEDLYAKIYGYIGMENLSKSAQAAINSKVESKDLENYSTIEQTETMISSEVGTLSGDISRVEQTTESLSSTVSSLGEGVSAAQQTADKIAWLIQSGTSASNMTLTDRLFELIAQDINLNGRVTVSSIEDTSSSVSISNGTLSFSNDIGLVGSIAMDNMRNLDFIVPMFLSIEGGAGVLLNSNLNVSLTACKGETYASSLVLTAATLANGNMGPVLNCGGHLWPVSSSYYIGSSNNRWAGVFLSSNPSVSSDARLKRDIEDMDGSLIDHLRPRFFRMKADPQKQRFGFIAQEVQDALHGMGIDDAALVDDENPESLGLCYEQIIAPLVAKVQAQQMRIDDLEARIARLEAKA